VGGSDPFVWRRHRLRGSKSKAAGEGACPTPACPFLDTISHGLYSLCYFLENLLFSACFRGFRGTIQQRGGCLMFIEIHELELHPIDFEEEIRPGVLDLGEDLRQVEVLHTAGRAQLVEEQHGKHKIVKDIRLAGNLKTRVELDCARCLEPVLQDVRHNFDLLYRPQGADAGREELSVTSAEAEVSYYQGEGLQLEDVLREQVILALPLRAICRDDCKGLCPHCGTNLNVEQCACAGPLEDPRWSPLKDIRGKLEH